MTIEDILGFQKFWEMGCFTRSLAEWVKDFWNNSLEFKKGTPEGEKRLKVFARPLEFLF